MAEESKVNSLCDSPRTPRLCVKVPRPATTVKSHTCEFEWKDLLLLAAGPLAPVALFALLMHGGAHLHLLPPPRPTLDTDRTIIIHQAQTSRAASTAEILLLGDSSCLMDVSAKELSARLGRPVLNLGTLSYLDPGAHARLLREFAAANPGRLRTVVLLMHPEALRRAGSEPYQLNVLTNYLAARDHFRTETTAGQISCLLGVDTFAGRVLSRVRPSPLGGAYGRQYGFTADLESYMTANLGSAFEPDSVPLSGSAEYRLSPAMKTAANEFRAALPSGAKLLVGLTPAPEKFAGAAFPTQQRELIQQWGDWLGADALLDGLPAALPDEQFARATHLKPSAVAAYTENLAQAIQSRLR